MDKYVGPISYELIHFVSEKSKNVTTTIITNDILKFNNEFIKIY